MSPPVDPDAVFAAIRDAAPDVTDRDELAALARLMRQHKGWYDAVQVRITRRTRALADEGRAERPKDLLTREGGQSGNDARTGDEREQVCTNLPGFESALAAGAVSAGHVDAIANATRNLDAEATAEFNAHAEDLLARAGVIGVDAFGRECVGLAQLIAAAAGSEGDVLDRQRRDSKVTRWIDKLNGMRMTKLALDPVRDAELQRSLQRQIKIVRNRPGGEKLSWDELQTQALIELITSAGTGQKVVQLVVLVDEQTLRDGLHDQGVCELSDGTPIPVGLVRQMACEAEIIPVVLNGKGQALDVGKAQRLATEAQRQALAAMHTTCAWPTCTVPVDQCEMHHVIPVERGGPTDLSNLLPVCLINGHHHQVHEGGWTLTMTPDREITITRPDGTIYYQGSSIDRAPQGVAA